MNKLVCWIKTTYHSLSWGWPFTEEYFSGHTFVDEEVHENCQVTISRCEHCGKLDISWCRGDSREAMQTRIKN